GDDLLLSNGAEFAAQLGQLAQDAVTLQCGADFSDGHQAVAILVTLPEEVVLAVWPRAIRLLLAFKNMAHENRPPPDDNTTDVKFCQTGLDLLETDVDNPPPFSLGIVDMNELGRAAGSPGVLA